MKFPEDRLWLYTLCLLLGFTAGLCMMAWKAAQEEPAERAMLHSLIKGETHGGHSWITFGDGGMYHHPDCPAEHSEPK